MPCWDKYWLTYFVALLGAVRYICSAVGWLGGSLISYFVGWLVSWLAGLLVGWLAGWLVRWIVAWLVGWLAGWLTKKCLRIPQISYGFKETFHFLILILARGAAYLITQLTRFLELRGSLFFRHRHPRYAGHFFFDIEIELKSKNSTRWQQSCHLVEFLVFNLAFGRYSRLLWSRE